MPVGIPTGLKKHVIFFNHTKTNFSHFSIFLSIFYIYLQPLYPSNGCLHFVICNWQHIFCFVSMIFFPSFHCTLTGIARNVYSFEQFYRILQGILFNTYFLLWMKKKIFEIRFVNNDQFKLLSFGIQFICTSFSIVFI